MTTNLCENFLSACCKMDRRKFYNTIQLGSFNHRCIAAALRVQCGPRWMTHVWQSLFDSVVEALDTYCSKRKRKYTVDSARKVLQKYKIRQLMTKLNEFVKDST